MSDEKNYGEMAGTGKVKAGSAAKMMFEAGMALGKAHKKIAELEAACVRKNKDGAAAYQCIAEREERIAALEATINDAAFERAEAISSDDVVARQREHIAALEARNAEVVAALPKWAEGPGIVGAVLHMAERIAALEAERAEARREGARKALEDAASYWESKDLNISMSQQVTTLDLVSAKLREMAAAIGGEVKGG